MNKYIWIVQFPRLPYFCYYIGIPIVGKNLKTLIVIIIIRVFGVRTMVIVFNISHDKLN